MNQYSYSPQFYSYINGGALRSAQRFAALLLAEIPVNSVLDIGCGQGAWLRAWADAGIDDIVGIDGPYVDPEALLIDRGHFVGHDLSKDISLDRHFDLATSIEVAEHLPASASGTIVDLLTSHADIVLFSAAVPGQGGENHINEQPLEYWQKLFADRGFSAYDFFRPRLKHDKNIERWYRFNAILYANEAGQQRLTEAVKATRVPSGTKPAFYGDLIWRLRIGLGRLLPVHLSTSLAVFKSRLIHS